jgi:hypothetical protein
VTIVIATLVKKLTPGIVFLQYSNEGPSIHELNARKQLHDSCMCVISSVTASEFVAKAFGGGGLQIPPNIRAEADARRLIIGPLKSMQLLDSSLRYRNCYLKLLMCDSKNNIWGMRYNFLLTFNEEMEQDDPYGRHWTACY